MWQETSTLPRSVHAEHNLQTLSSPDSIFTNVQGFAKVQAEFWLRAKEKKKRCLSHGDKTPVLVLSSSAFNLGFEGGDGDDRGWHHRLNGHEFEEAPGVGDGQGGLACCSPWSRKELDMTE